MKSLGIDDSDVSEAAIEKSAAHLFETRVPFQKWLQSLDKRSTPNTAAESMNFEGVAVSDCEVLFDGLLKVDGFLKGAIRSAHGTLVMTERGRVEADVDVRIAIIDGHLEGNLRATEHVILNSNARVAGNIHTPSLSIRDGAVFEGNSFFLERSIYSEICKMGNDADLLGAMAIGA